MHVQQEVTGVHGYWLPTSGATYTGTVLPMLHAAACCYWQMQLPSVSKAEHKLTARH